MRHQFALAIIIVLLVAFITTPRPCTINHIHPKTVIEHDHALVPNPTPTNPMIDELDRVQKAIRDMQR